MTQYKTKAIIEKAIQGGWEAFGHCSKACLDPAIFEIDGKVITFIEEEYPEEGSASYDIEKVFLDQTFFQSLGKSCGWINSHGWERGNIHHFDYDNRQGDCAFCISMCFHEINLTEGFDAAIDYLYNLITTT